MPREIKRDSLVSVTDVLLFDIRDILTKAFPEYVEVPEVKEVLAPRMDCKYCGGFHDKPQQISACAKKNKKE